MPVSSLAFCVSPVSLNRYHLDFVIENCEQSVSVHGSEDPPHVKPCSVKAAAGPSPPIIPLSPPAALTVGGRVVYGFHAGCSL